MRKKYLFHLKLSCCKHGYHQDYYTPSALGELPSFVWRVPDLIVAQLILISVQQDYSMHCKGAVCTALLQLDRSQRQERERSQGSELSSGCAQQKYLSLPLHHYDLNQSDYVTSSHTAVKKTNCIQFHWCHFVLRLEMCTHLNHKNMANPKYSFT